MHFMISGSHGQNINSIIKMLEPYLDTYIVGLILLKMNNQMSCAICYFNV